jgi:sialate O-acetylesterase
LQPKRAVGRLRRMLLHVFAWISLASGSTAWSLDFHPIYADGMVVQRDRPVVVRGTAEPGAEVVLELISRPAANNPTATARTTASPDGQWQMELPGRTPEDAPLSLVAASGPAEKTVKDIRVGDVWLCAGQSNMNFLMRPNLPWSEGVLDWEEEVRSADDQELRFFTVVPEASHTAQEVAHGLWRPASPEFAGYLSAVPFYFGKGIRQTAGVPVGIIVSALGGTSIREWSAPEALRGCPDAENALARHVTLREKHADQVREYYGKQAPAYRQSAVSRMAEPAYAAAYNEPYKGWRHQPSGLFNAMIRPLDWFPIKGILWYQGESDTTRSELYRERLERMIAGQRARRNEPQLPFIVVQLANHDPVARGKDAAKYGDTWALLREAQEEATGLPFTALVVTADVGHATNIHPRDKKTVGTRAAQAAASLVYETSGMAFGPTLTSWEASGREVHLQFANTNGGLVIDRDRSSGDGPDFELAGSDGQFHPASADVRGSQVILSAPEVTEPVSVRYCFHNNPRLVLFDKNGLPARPFRRPAAGEKASR